MTESRPDAVLELWRVDGTWRYRLVAGEFALAHEIRHPQSATTLADAIERSAADMRDYAVGKLEERNHVGHSEDTA